MPYLAYIMKLLILISALFLVTGVTAQKTRTIPIVNSGNEAKVEVFVNNPSVKTDLKKTYAWFKSKEVHFTQGSYEGVLLHGKFVSFHRDEQLKEEGIYQTGLKHGLWKKWYQNGRLKETTNWSKGIKDGASTSYNEDGTVQTQCKFRNNQFHGNVVTFENGKETSSKKFKNGEEVLPKVKVIKPVPVKSDSVDSSGKIKPFKVKEKNQTSNEGVEKVKKKKSKEKKPKKKEQKEAEHEAEKP